MFETIIKFLKEKQRRFLTFGEDRKKNNLKNKKEKPENKKETAEENSQEDKEQERVTEKFSENIPERCPYCQSRKIVRRGKRKKKFETVQLYLCKTCGRTFTAQTVKGKRYPLKLILDSLSIYNLGYTLEGTARLIREKYGLLLKSATLASWIKEFEPLCKYLRLRRFGKKLYTPNQVAPGINLYHRQVYKFRIHRAKLSLLINEDHRNYRLEPVKEFLEAMFQECPHHLFKESQRISEAKMNLDLRQVIIRSKKNFANRLAKLVLQTVKNNKERHEEIEKFFIYNDSATVATEVPVYILPEDIEYLEEKLNFRVPLKERIEIVMSGHIDLVQIRNGSVHILDYKPNARKEKPIEQLTLYAIAMSRLTGLRIYDFKCAWFDENDYFEFFPLHIIHKIKEKMAKVPENQQKLLEV